MERRPDSLAGSEPAPAQAGSPRGAGPDCGLGASAAATLGSARRVPIGIAAVDDMLGGGIPPGIIVDVFGGHGTGKTQIMMQAAARFAACGKRVLFVDTAGTFRPERVLQMAGASASREAILGMISVARVQNVAEQEGVVARLLLQQQTRHGPAAEFDLVVVDSLTDLFSYEYSRYGDLRERNRLFFGYMRSLARLAVHHGVTVMTSNVVRMSGDAEVENMAAEVDMFAHVRIRLAREELDSAVAATAGAADKVLHGHASCVMLDSPCRNGGGSRDARHNNRDDNYNDSNDGRAHADNYGLAHDHKGSDGDRDHGVKFSYRIESGGITTSGYDSDSSHSDINLP